MAGAFKKDGRDRRELNVAEEHNPSWKSFLVQPGVAHILIIFSCKRMTGKRPSWVGVPPVRLPPSPLQNGTFRRVESSGKAKAQTSVPRK